LGPIFFHIYINDLVKFSIYWNQNIFVCWRYQYNSNQYIFGKFGNTNRSNIFGD
jgi:hypothetical protein